MAGRYGLDRASIALGRGTVPPHRLGKRAVGPCKIIRHDGVSRAVFRCIACAAAFTPPPPPRKGGKICGVWSFFPPCEGGTQGGSSSASALRQVRHPGDNGALSINR